MSAKSPTEVVSKKGSFYRSTPKRQPKPREWFIDQGCRQVPMEHSKNKVRFGHPDGYFLKQDGLIAKDTFPPSQYSHRGGSAYPRLRECVNACHILMAYAFYGERPSYVNAKGKIKPFQAHHLNGDKFDYRPANILAWLHPAEHRLANARQDKLQELVPNGDLRGFDYDILREFQDPRTMSDEDFQSRLAYIRVMRDCNFDPRIFTADDFHHWFSMPFEEFKSFFEHYKND